MQYWNFLTEMQTDRENMLTEVCNTGENILQAMQVSQLYEDKMVDENKENVNAVTTNALADIINTLKLLKQEMNEIKSSAKPSGTKAPKAGKKKRKPRLDTSKYCWSCGAWNHFSRDCRNKQSGHQDSATFKNRMGGSIVCVQCTE